jgi:hypothetical protein
MIFKDIFAENLGEKIGVYYSKPLKLLIMTLVFAKNAIFSPKIVENRRKLLKIAENC